MGTKKVSESGRKKFGTKSANKQKSCTVDPDFQRPWMNQRTDKGVPKMWKTKDLKGKHKKREKGHTNNLNKLASPAATLA